MSLDTEVQLKEEPPLNVTRWQSPVRARISSDFYTRQSEHNTILFFSLVSLGNTLNVFTPAAAADHG